MDYPALITIGVIVVIILFFILRYFIWVIPREKNIDLSRQLEVKIKENQELQSEVARLRRTNADNATEFKNQFLNIKQIYLKSIQTIGEQSNDNNIKEIIRIITDTSIKEFNQLCRSDTFIEDLSKTKRTYINILLSEEIEILKDKISLLESDSNLSAIPYMAELIADFETYEIERIAQSLDYGYSVQRHERMNKIRDIRKHAQEIVERNKESQYQLAYLLNLFPTLADVIECEYTQLPSFNFENYKNYDCVKDYLTKEEYDSLSDIEKNQLALDRYKKSRNKSKWQIGRDYEQYIGYVYTQQGYEVDNFGTYMGLEDLGRDIIAKKDGRIIIIQCKYWSSIKQIHEKHITQLYGTVASYCVEKSVARNRVKGLLVTNIKLSDMAKKMAKHLNVDYTEDVPLGEYPCIKCNIGYNEDGNQTQIYHLPFDQQYDNTKIEPRKGDFYAMTVQEAEEAGFRRAKKWFGI